MYNLHVNTLHINTFIPRLQPEKLLWALSTKQRKEPSASLLFPLCFTAQIDATALLGSVSKTPLLIFRVLLCNILTGFPRHIHTLVHIGSALLASKTESGRQKKTTLFVLFRSKDGVHHDSAVSVGDQL